jgi:acetyl-CoA C-acetyltransferase
LGPVSARCQTAVVPERPTSSATAATPAIVGAAQTIDRPGEHELSSAPGPIELMVAAARAAAADAGAPSLLGRVGWVGVAGGFFPHRNPGAVVAEQLGVPGAGTALSEISGTAPQDLVGLACQRIAAGELDVALVLGGEARWSAQRLKREGLEPGWDRTPGDGEPEVIGGFAPEMIAEMAAMGSAAASYALFEDALRQRAGRTVAEQRDHCARLWGRFSEVAETNPYAWDRSHHRVADIRDASASNRMIAFPYPKAMVANNTVNMASAILIASEDAARAAGVADDRRAYPLVVTSSHETWEVLRRADLDGSPALSTAAATALEHADLTIDRIDHVDLYACFPSIVQMSSAALGLSEDRQLTVTGGLGFAGAAISNSVGHSIAAMVPLVRAGGLGLVHGNGGSATKHSFAVYSPEPPAAFARIDCQDRVDLGEREALPQDHAGSVHVDAATVRFDREGPSDVLAAVRAEDGRMAWATSADPELIDRVMTDGLAGATATRAADGTFTEV